MAKPRVTTFFSQDMADYLVNFLKIARDVHRTDLRLVGDLTSKKRVTRHTLRRTYSTLLHANAENVKVAQQLLRQSSTRITMAIHAQVQIPNGKKNKRLSELMRTKKPTSEEKKMA